MNDYLRSAWETRQGWVDDHLPMAVDGRAVVGNPFNGDVMYLGLKVDRETDTFTEILWRVEGSEEAIMLVAALVAKLQGMPLDTVLGWSAKELLEAVDVHDAAWYVHGTLVQSAFAKASNNYFAKSGQKDRIGKEERNVICACQDISDFDIRQVYLRGNQTVTDIMEATGAGKECELCHERIAELHQELLREFPMNVHAHIRH